MTRPYTMTRRAERQSDTRQRIVEAAIGLHGSVGPARTTFSMVAEKAGVQRHTLYAHFPTEKSLLLACSGQHLATDPPPDAAEWAGIADCEERLRVALGAIYAWYARNDQLFGNVLRDAEHHAPTREIVELRFGPGIAAWHATLAGETPADAALVGLALGFHSWRALVRDGGLAPEAAVRAMVAVVVAGADAAVPTRQDARRGVNRG